MSVGEYVEALDCADITTAALTDTHTLFGAYKFYSHATDSGITPIIGSDVWMNRSGKSTWQGRSDRTRVRVIVENRRGYRNLCQLLSRSYRQRRDRGLWVSWQELKQRQDGLFVLISPGLTPDRPERSMESEVLRELIENRFTAFGDRLRVEIPVYNTVNEYRDLLFRISKEVGVKPVVTHPCYFTESDRFESMRLRRAIQTNTVLAELKNFPSYRSHQWVMPAETINQHLTDSFDTALNNTNELAERCEFEFETKAQHIPSYPFLDKETDSFLEEKCRARIGERSLDATESKVEDRLNHELEIISSMDFADYFLIVADIVNWAKNEGISVGPGRGSACGSLVSYLLNITDVDPFEFDLIFERFLNPDRNEMPDIDVDFADYRRESVIQYITERFGHESVAQIITFGRLKAKNSLRDVGRVREEPQERIDEFVESLPIGRDTTLTELEQNSTELQDSLKKDPDLKQWFNQAKSLEGLVRNPSIHAAGMIVGDGSLENSLPLYFPDESNPFPATQYDMYDAEALGFLKLDILGLTTLTQIDRALTFIPETDRPVLSQLPDYDQTTFYVIGHYSLEGIFQFESQSGRDLAHEMKPESRRELVDCIALNRPGPAQYRSTYLARRSGNEPVEYPHDDLSKILGDTYGLIIYQEQVMAIARTIGGFSWAEADRMRKAMGKKKPELMKTLEKKFVEGAVDNGYERKWSSGLFEKLAKFAEYGFNRSHSAAYGEITYQTAYLKAHFPVEFYASLLTVKSNDRDRIGQIRSAMLDDFIPLFSPEINKSMAKFSPEERGVRHGLTAVKHVGSRLAKKIQMESEQNAFDSLEDFFSRISPDLIQTQAFQALSASGFFDPLGIERGVLIDNAESILQEGLKIYSEEESGQENLFAQNKSSFTDPFQFDQDASSKWIDSRLRKAQRQSIGYAETQLALLPYLHLGTFCESNNTQRIGFLEGLNTDETQITFTGLSTKAKQYPYNFDTDKVTTSGQVVIGDFDSTGGREILQKIIPLDEKSTQLKLDICFKSEVSRNNLNDLKTILSANPGSNHVGVSVSESKKTYLLDEKVEFSQSMAYSLKAWGEYNSLRIDTADDVLDSGN